MLCVTILGKIVEGMKSVLNRAFLFIRILSLSFIVAFVSLSILTYHADDLSFNVATDSPVKNLCGIIGSHVADILVQIFGISSLVIIPLMIFCIVNMLYGINRNIYLYLISSLVIVSGISGLISNVSLKIIHKCDYCGVLGTYFHDFPIIVLLAIILVGIVGIISWKKVVYLYGIFLRMFSKLTHKHSNTSDITEREEVHQDVAQAQEFYNVKNLLDEEGLTKELVEEVVEDGLADELDFLDREGLEYQIEENNDDRYDDNDNEYDDEEDNEYDEEDDEYDEEDDEYDDDEYGDNEKDDDECSSEREEVVYNKPQINLQVIQEKKKNKEFILPSVNYLSKSNPTDGREFRPDNNVVSLLDKVLKDFSIYGKIVNIRYGPVVTLYEFEPSAGTKSSRVIGLSDDIARSMSALSTRISVIPGRNVMGIELPNHYREIVMLRDLLESQQYKDSKLKLPIALGKGIDGEVVIADLVKMPHILIAGTTGSGKSVAINTMILSLVYSLTPDQCKMIMIDPKVLELSVYNSIPHLLTPVVTESKKAIAALKWVVSEMENRYRLMSDIGVRNIVGYNDKIKEAISENRVLEKVLQTGFDKETGEAIFEKIVIEPRVFPYIVVIVDEMADLMLVAGKEIESSIQRLSQMARAAGIHIIMATQRPSVDVITGVIKANFPTRISFAVTSKIDSRTILGEQGAEQLLGMGDMLYMVSGGRIIRVHGAFVSDDEVQSIVEYLKSQGIPEYIEGITQVQQDYDYCIDDNISERDDELYQQAVSIVMRDRRTSISYIQRQLRIGYNRAANLVERMERDGVIGIANTGKREILLE
ncbi:FtsK/SpoIIIE family DNA translocase [Ehrlichia muris]|uniref:FtsK/SpoIIIE family DNA translocase n=2 Tax=Anaplasmataceae TaxID=942 RepID=UPI0005F7F430|nr:DNA translocase FtsK 4TM domain-containing protein [Ehrlichia muris]OUC04269.1 cell division protein FtsK [Ehrlichia sp. Wisconsin_h]